MNPSRAKRIENPGEPDKKRHKRTTAEVLADKERKERITLELVEVEKQKILLLAAMEVEDEEAEDEELLNVTRNRDDREVSPETFLFDEVDAEPSDDEEDDRGGKKATVIAKAKITVRCDHSDWRSEILMEIGDILGKISEETGQWRNPKSS